MRVVAGRAGGLRLVAPTGDQTRPTSDRTREAVFNSLGSLGVLTGAAVLDLYCGSGAMGIEALSRGAVSATFVDRSGAAMDAVRTNLTTCSFTSDAELLRGDAFAELRGPLAGRDFDIAFVDPPYGFEEWPELLSLLDAAVLVLESDKPIDPGDDREVLRQRRYGGTVVTIADHPDHPDPDHADNADHPGPDRIVRPVSEDRS